MPYATEADLDTKWGATNVDIVVGLDPATGVRLTGRVDGALAAATARINGYLAQRYNLPVDATPDGVILLRNLCCDLAMGELANEPGVRNDIIKDAEKRALDLLTAIAKGQAAIPENPQPGAPAPSPNEAVLIANDREFTRSRLRGM